MDENEEAKLRTLSDLGQKERIQILLSEYAGLRAEINARTGFGFHIFAISAAVITWLLLQPLTWRFWIGLILLLAAGGIASWVNVRDIWRAAHRCAELEHEINSRAGEHLLIWERLHGAARKNVVASFFSTLSESPRASLPPLDPSYILRDAPSSDQQRQ